MKQLIVVTPIKVGTEVIRPGSILPSSFDPDDLAWLIASGAVREEEVIAEQPYETDDVGAQCDASVPPASETPPAADPSDTKPKKRGA